MASKYTYSEMFYSFQGEGRFVGVPSIFFRTFGCNLNCHGFGQAQMQNLIPIEYMPYMKFDVSNAKSLEDVPVCDIGCDSAGSWAERYRHLANQAKPHEVAEMIRELGVIQNDQNKHHQSPHLVITGGEPLLKGLQGLHTQLFNDPAIGHINSVTFETNGTQFLTNELMAAPDNREYNFSVSPKLSNSAEPFEKAIIPEAVRSYTTFMLSHPWLKSSGKLWFKFVVRDETQIEEIYRALDLYDNADVWWNDVFLMPEGGTVEGLEATTEIVAELAMKYGFSYSPRAHVDVFGNRWGT